MPTCTSPLPSRLPGLALAAIALLAAGVAAAPAAAAKGACKGRTVHVRVAHRSACLRASAPARSVVAEQRAFDRALLASRLRPSHGHARGRTVGAWLGSARTGLTAIERALAGAPPAHAARAGTAIASRGWSTSTKDRTPADAAGSSLLIVSRRGKAKLTLDSSYVAKAEHCPDATGAVPGTRTRKISLKLEVGLAGGRTLTIKSSQSTTASFTGTTNDAAALAQIDFGKVKTKASASGELRDAHGKLLAQLSPTGASATIKLPTALGTEVSWPAVLTDPATAFVASAALKALVRGDGASLDPLLRRFVTQMQTDAWSTYDQARGALLDAQHHWWQAGRCLHLVLETSGGDHVAVGGHLPLRVTAVLTSAPRHPKHAGVGALPLTATATDGTVAPAAARTAATSASQSDPLTFAFAASAQAGSPTVTVAVVSKQGTASASVGLTVTSNMVYLKATAVGGSYDMAYSATENGPSCTYASNDHYDLTLGASDGPDGSISGGLGMLIVPTHKAGTANGTVTCPGAPGDDRTCTRALDDDGSYYLDVDHADGAAAATLRFHALQQPYNDCASVVKDGGETTGVTNPTIDTTVPWSQLSGTAPFTVHVQGTFHDGSHVVTRDYTLTLQPVDADGHPLA